ncbi:hypothetical protein WKV44_07755 [Spirochaetia bacterium 38H-sp]|uniref:Lipocalin-like domain-containing protein n=1 Tax=Rarispira pelagica TaxID=3141764 RepID=A0ABU9UE63_9SPIR
MKKTNHLLCILLIPIITTIAVSCTQAESSTTESMSYPIEGTWKLTTIDNHTT